MPKDQHNCEDILHYM